jgi:exodeoxyribonuclease VII large subunit
LPKYPKRIGVLTSSSGSVIHDIIHRIRDRFPLTQILLYPIPVQGKNSHIETIEYLDLIEDKSNYKKPDLLIFARGGGSLEEMMPFNEIDLIKRVFDLKIPSISAIGHETDYTLLDLVCDLRAPTPTAAAELAVPNQVQITTHLNDKKISLIELLKKKIREPELFIIKFQSSIGILSSRVYETEKKINNNLNTNLKNINNFFISKKDFIYKEIIKINDFSPKQKILIFENKINSIKKNNKMFILNKLKFLSKNIFTFTKNHE